MQEGLEKTDKDNEELRSGLQNCLMTINKVKTSGQCLQIPLAYIAPMNKLRKLGGKAIAEKP